MQEIRDNGIDHDIYVEFKKEGYTFIKSTIPIPSCIQFRYFEVEVIENKGDFGIYFGIIEEKETFLSRPD